MKLLNPYLDLCAELRSLPAEHQLAIRKKLIWAYSWAIPNGEAIEELRRLSPLIELGAGSGYWAWLLRQAGADVIALDKNPKAPPQWTQVEFGDESRVGAYSDRALFLCWPSFQEAMAFNALRDYQGSDVAYVGEMMGRTADADFHRLLAEKFVLRREITIPVWPGYYDRLYLFEKRGSG